MLKQKPIVVMEMNHFCLDVLQRITIPDFLDFMRSVFPQLYAVDTDNSTIVDLHVPDKAYMVMHEHVVKHRFPNIVGGFYQNIKSKLDQITMLEPFKTPILTNPAGKIVVQNILRTARVGETFELSINLSNETEEVWHGYGDHPVLLSYHWKNQDGSYLVYDGIRTELQNVDLEPGKTVNEKIRVLAPNDKGTYQLMLTVVQEGVCWFEDNGFKCASVSIQIG